MSNPDARLNAALEGRYAIERELVKADGHGSWLRPRSLLMISDG